MRLHHPSHRQLETGCTARLASCDGASTITYAANASGLTQTAACLSTRRCEVTRFRHDAGCWLFKCAEAPTEAQMEAPKDAQAHAQTHAQTNTDRREW
jgi:hypothetical protein